MAHLGRRIRHPARHARLGLQRRRIQAPIARPRVQRRDDLRQEHAQRRRLRLRGGHDGGQQLLEDGGQQEQGGQVRHIHLQAQQHKLGGVRGVVGGQEQARQQALLHKHRRRVAAVRHARQQALAHAPQLPLHVLHVRRLRRAVCRQPLHGVQQALPRLCAVIRLAPVARVNGWQAVDGRCRLPQRRNGLLILPRRVRNVCQPVAPEPSVQGGRDGTPSGRRQQADDAGGEHGRCYSKRKGWRRRSDGRCSRVHRFIRCRSSSSGSGSGGGGGNCNCANRGRRGGEGHIDGGDGGRGGRVGGNADGGADEVPRQRQRQAKAAHQRPQVRRRHAPRRGGVHRRRVRRYQGVCIQRGRRVGAQKICQLQEHGGAQVHTLAVHLERHARRGRREVKCVGIRGSRLRRTRPPRRRHAALKRGGSGRCAKGSVPRAARLQRCHLLVVPAAPSTATAARICLHLHA